jgi:hypothetical protein
MVSGDSGMCDAQCLRPFVMTATTLPSLLILFLVISCCRSICRSPDMSMMSSESTDIQITIQQTRQLRIFPMLTITGHSREEDIHIDNKLLASRAVHDDGWLEMHFAVIDEFQDSRHRDNCERDKCHCLCSPTQ